MRERKQTAEGSVKKCWQAHIQGRREKLSWGGDKWAISISESRSDRRIRTDSLGSQNYK